MTYDNSFKTLAPAQREEAQSLYDCVVAVRCTPGFAASAKLEELKATVWTFVRGLGFDVDQ